MFLDYLTITVFNRMVDAQKTVFELRIHAKQLAIFIHLQDRGLIKTLVNTGKSVARNVFIYHIELAVDRSGEIIIQQMVYIPNTLFGKNGFMLLDQRNVPFIGFIREPFEDEYTLWDSSSDCTASWVTGIAVIHNGEIPSEN